MKNRRIIPIIILVLCLITLPYLAAWISGGGEYVFGGFLVNPYDGNSYLAKMMEGYSGNWAFTLPYSIDPGAGTYLFLFYLFLGHISRFTGLEPIFIFHISRLIGFAFLYFVLYRFCLLFFKQNENSAFLAYIMIAIGSGMGWLLLPFGIRTSDLWVAEAYPFLSSFQNPHFPFGLGLMILTLILFYRADSIGAKIAIVFCGLLLAVILPFGAVIIGLVAFVQQVWAYFQKGTLHLAKIGLLALGTLPFVAYQYYAVNTHSQLGIWNQQNLTPSPAIWDFAISFAPAILFAVLAILYRRKTAKSDLFDVMTVWLILGAIIIYLPVGIQRRFMVGYYFPVSLLSSAFILALENKRLRIAGFATILASSSITIFIVLLAGISGIITRSPLIYLTRAENEAMEWLKSNLQTGDAVLADSRLGMIIPARTGLRVIYGHPFETVNADRNKESVESFFSCNLAQADAEKLIAANSIHFVLSTVQGLAGCYPAIFSEAEISFESQQDGNTIQVFRVP